MAASIVSYAVAGCSESPTDPGEFDFPSAVIYGSVETEEGQPVPATEIVVEHRTEGCSSLWTQRGETLSNPDGRFRMVFRLGTTLADSSCFVLQAFPPEDSGLLPSSGLQFDVEFRLGAPQDSVQVNVLLAGE